MLADELNGFQLPQPPLGDGGLRQEGLDRREAWIWDCGMWCIVWCILVHELGARSRMTGIVSDCKYVVPNRENAGTMVSQTVGQKGRWP